MHFSKKSGCQSSACPEILAFMGHCSANFQPILDYFIPNSKLKYEDSENIKVDRVNTIVFKLREINRRAFFLGHPVEILEHNLNDSMAKIPNMNEINIAYINFLEENGVENLRSDYKKTSLYIYHCTTVVDFSSEKYSGSTGLRNSWY